MCKELNLDQAEKIVNWYALIGNKNWGVWEDYPISGKYLSFDDCHLQIKLEKPLIFQGNEINFITDGKEPISTHNRDYTTISNLVNHLKRNGVTFINNQTKKSFDSKVELEVERKESTIRHFEAVLTNHEYQKKEVEKQIYNALEDVRVSRPKGEALPKEISNYILELKNYAENKDDILIVKLVLKGKNSKNTAGYYKATNYDQNKLYQIIEDFTKERVESSIKTLNYHKEKLQNIKSTQRLR